MRLDKKRSISSNKDKEIEITKTKKGKPQKDEIEEDGEQVRAVVNCEFTEYSPVEEQEETTPKH